ncbi:P27 family phage terminase small subunit [Paraburkholderia sp. CNPSo 3076]|uniref:P27 family phage terminase small subunit n=1 Tax=Paraburkholderia sp. CNPSo 3076 TaxID=2940936 RepID=UPI003A522C3E
MKPSPKVFQQPAKAGDARLLARLSPNALALWSSVARQLSGAGLLDSVDGELLLCYCEAYARWCATGDPRVPLVPH